MDNKLKRHYKKEDQQKNMCNKLKGNGKWTNTLWWPQ